MVRTDTAHILTDEPRESSRVTATLRLSREALRALADGHAELLDEVERVGVALVGRELFDRGRMLWLAIADACDGDAGDDGDEVVTVDEVYA